MAVIAQQSPLPGVFYRRPAPDADPFCQPGDTVAAGTVVALIEVMKQFFEVTAEVGGVIEAFPVDNESPVEPGEVIIRIREAD